MSTVAPSDRMHTWTATPASVPTDRLQDPGIRRRLAESALEHLNVGPLRTQVQAGIDHAIAAGTDAREVLRAPATRQALLRAATASRELRLATALLAL